MAIFLSFLLILPAWADAPDVKYYQAREKATREYIANRDKGDAASEADRERIKNQRQKREEKLQSLRENFDRKSRSNTDTDLEKSYLAALEVKEQKRQVRQEAYAVRQRELQKYIDEHITPLKAQEYDIEDINENADRR